MAYEIGGGSLNSVANSIGQGIAQFGQYSAQAAARANGVSAGAQKAQGTFNQASANNANNIGADRIAQQYAFNSGAALDANNFSREMWELAAAFNSEEAEKQRQWQEHMRDTAYQAAVKDMSAAGLNPILAVTGGGISTGTGGGSAASISPISGQMASGGLMNGISASEGSYSGQMEYMGGLLGLLSAGISGISSALKSFGGLGEGGKAIADALVEIFKDDKGNDKNYILGNSKSGGLYYDDDSLAGRFFGLFKR